MFRKVHIRKSSYIFYFALSAGLLTVIQPPFNLSFLAWIAFVPFVLACLSRPSFRPESCEALAKQDEAEKSKKQHGIKLILIAYIIGIIYWLGNLYWLIPITIAGWIAACLYIALYWPLVVITLRFCTEKKIPLWFSLPVLIVGQETLQGWLFGWRFLAHSQYQNLSLIQIADTFGTAGISFIIAMVNGLIAQIFFSRKENQKTNMIVGASITAILIAATIFYGRYRINQTAQYSESGPKIGVVQSNVPVKAAEDTVPFEKIFIDQLSLSVDAFDKANPALVIWPETMVETVLDERYLTLVPDGYASKVINNEIVYHASEGVYVLVGAFAGDAQIVNDKVKLKSKYNTAFLYEPNQPFSKQFYNKIHLVPFGEYMPLKKEFPFLYKILLAMTPYDYDYTLDKGTEYTIFKMPVEDKNYRFAVSICFEDIVPKVCRKLVVQDGIKQADWLVNISNDGWFVRQVNDKIKASTELSQHMAICVFRAIENRISIVRCANTGISCMIDSTGKIKNDFLTGTLNKKAALRTGQAGWFVDNIKIDKRVTVFSKNIQFLPASCALCLILSAVLSIYNLSKKHKESETL